MTPRQHAHLARQLIAACGGCLEAAEACRLGKSQLSNCQNPNHDSLMPVDVIAALEAYCGAPVYSGAMARLAGVPVGSGDLLGESVLLSSCAMDLLSHVHESLADGVVTPRERDALRSQLAKTQDAITRLTADLSDKSTNGSQIDEVHSKK